MVTASEALAVARCNIFEIDPMLQVQVLEIVELLGSEHPNMRKVAEDMVIQTTPGLSTRIEAIAGVFSRDRPTSSLSINTNAPTSARTTTPISTRTSDAQNAPASAAQNTVQQTEKRKKTVVVVDSDSDSDFDLASVSDQMRLPKSVPNKRKKRNSRASTTAERQECLSHA